MPDDLLIWHPTTDVMLWHYSVCGSDIFCRTGVPEQHRGLHFELCYYQHIEIAIQRGLRQLEAARKESTR